MQQLTILHENNNESELLFRDLAYIDVPLETIVSKPSTLPQIFHLRLTDEESLCKGSIEFEVLYKPIVKEVRWHFLAKEMIIKYVLIHIY